MYIIIVSYTYYKQCYKYNPFHFIGILFHRTSAFKLETKELKLSVFIFKARVSIYKACSRDIVKRHTWTMIQDYFSAKVFKLNWKVRLLYIYSSCKNLSLLPSYSRGNLELMYLENGVRILKHRK